MIRSLPLLDYMYFESPLGWILPAAFSRGIYRLQFCGVERPSEATAQEFLEKRCPGCSPVQKMDSPLLSHAQQTVELYFAAGTQPGKVPLDLHRGTRLQQRVWEALGTILFGKTRSYGQIAAAIRQQRTTRTVGQACGRNPVPILVPCYKVLATGGKLGGYSGGLHIKKALLELKGITLPS